MFSKIKAWFKKTIIHTSFHRANQLFENQEYYLAMDMLENIKKYLRRHGYNVGQLFLKDNSWHAQLSTGDMQLVSDLLKDAKNVERYKGPVVSRAPKDCTVCTFFTTAGGYFICSNIVIEDEFDTSLGKKLPMDKKKRPPEWCPFKTGDFIEQYQNLMMPLKSHLLDDGNT